MKNCMLIAGAAVAAALSVAARAEGSVTLYGTIDTGLAYLNHAEGGKSRASMSSGALSANEWGLTGSEDLGGGISAIFTLENNFDVATGQLDEGRLFGSKAFVGIASDRWGKLTLGRQNDPVTDLVQPITADAFSGLFAPPGDVDNYDSSATFSNAVKWTSATWRGATVAAMVSPGGVAGASGSGLSYAGAVGYADGALSVAAGYLHVDNGNAIHSTRGASSADAFFKSAVSRAYASARSIGIARADAQYAIGNVTVGAAFSFSEYRPDASSSFVQAERYRNGSAFVQWQALPSLLTIVGYNFTWSGGDSSARYHQVNVGADYLLSKRTDLYTTVGYQHANGFNGAGPAQAVIGSYNVDAGTNSQLLAIVGIRHRF
ncbi:porin [Burkholderia lata]|uniref:porin n=1 Tax=Burkholderia lata (strain ATCC 17760 / DSM 23089 / LMG 22485 / NCIMB 9086 / R18194 / 383) TaxID=482957 RepID=UPI0015831E2A|nr:porin [Burkholderia lata]